MIAQIGKTYFGKSCSFQGRVPEDSYFSWVLRYITQHTVPDVSQEHAAFIFKGLESEKNTSQTSRPQKCVWGALAVLRHIPMSQKFGFFSCFLSLYIWKEFIC